MYFSLYLLSRKVKFNFNENEDHAEFLGLLPRSNFLPSERNLRDAHCSNK